MPLRVLAIDDHALFRRCMLEYLANSDEVTAVWEAANPDAALALLEQTSPDIVLLDIDLGGYDGLALAKTIRDSYPQTPIVILTAADSEVEMLRAINLGAQGYLLKDIKPELLVSAMRRVLGGQTVFAQGTLLAQLAQVQPSASPTVGDEMLCALTKREVEVLQLVTDGLMDKQIADKLSVSENTVKNHMKSVRRKLGVVNRMQASRRGIELGLIKPYSAAKSARITRIE